METVMVQTEGQDLVRDDLVDVVVKVFNQSNLEIVENTDMEIEEVITVEEEMKAQVVVVQENQEQIIRVEEVKEEDLVIKLEEMV